MGPVHSYHVGFCSLLRLACNLVVLCSKAWLSRLDYNCSEGGDWEETKPEMSADKESYSFFRLIQTRGRARKAGSRFIVISDPDQISLRQKLKEQEDLLDIFLGPLRHGPSNSTRSIFEQLQQNAELDALKLERRSLVVDGYPDLVFFVFVEVWPPKIYVVVDCHRDLIRLRFQCR